MTNECIRHHDLVIIGGGFTGMTAGIYATRGRMDVLLLEGRITGGQLNNADVIENYPGFPEGVMATDLVSMIEKQATRFDLKIERAEVELLQPRESDFLLQTSIGDLCAGAIIVATGGQHKHLGVPGERELAGKGVSYCATCDGPLFRNRRIVVVGGGNTAIDEALYLARFAEKVFVVHRRDELRAEKILQERAFADPKLEFLLSTIVTEIHGKDFVESVTLKNLKHGEISTLPAGAIFIAIGMQPTVGFLPERVARDDHGFIIVDREMQTSVPGLFAAGDVLSGSARQLTTGIGEATIAVLSAQKHLECLQPK